MENDPDGLLVDDDDAIGDETDDVDIDGGDVTGDDDRGDISIPDATKDIMDAPPLPGDDPAT
jgi:hypothetical protein